MAVQEPPYSFLCPQRLIMGKEKIHNNNNKKTHTPKEFMFRYSHCEDRKTQLQCLCSYGNASYAQLKKPHRRHTLPHTHHTFPCTFTRQQPSDHSSVCSAIQPLVFVVPTFIMLVYFLFKRDKTELGQGLLSFSLALGLNGVITDIIKLFVGKGEWERERERFS